MARDIKSARSKIGMTVICLILFKVMIPTDGDMAVASDQVLSPAAISSNSQTQAATTEADSQPKTAEQGVTQSLTPTLPSNSLQGNSHSKKNSTYTEEKRIQSNPSSVGTKPVLPVTKDGISSSTGKDNNLEPKDEIVLPTPSLKGLISIGSGLNPYGLDASYSQEIDLRDVLQATLNGGLDICETRASVQAQKYLYLQALAKFLPDAVLNYSLMGADGTIKMPGGFLGGPSGVQTSRIDSPFTIANAGFRFKAYQGGSVLFGSIQSKHQLNAVKKQAEGTVNDSLFAAAENYYNLVLNEALLQIRLKAVERSQEQVNQNGQLEANGLATYLDVLQAKTQLARDKQDLLSQQAARRVAAVQLAHNLNISLAQDLIPATRKVRKQRLIDGDLLISDLLTYAVDNRPELKQYEELRKAARAQIVIAAAHLQPQVLFNGNVYGIGTTLSDLGSLFALSLGVNWTLGNLGLGDMANIQAAKWQARQALIKANKQFVNVFDQVRTAYDNTLIAEQKIQQTNEEVASAQEEMRLSKLRLDSGLSTNLEVLTAQRDLTQSSINQAQAVINFNLSQVQLLHDIGLISVDNLTSGQQLAKAKGYNSL